MNHITGTKIYISGNNYTDKQLQKNKITTIIDLTCDDVNNVKTTDNVYIHHFPMFDDEEQNILKYFYDIFKVIDDAQGNVLVNCVLGKSRSVSVVTGYLIFHGIPYEDAIKHVKSCRKIADPNDGFRDQLKALSDLFFH